jgi:drug/metabolite transporter (DMT)-like permease
VWLACGGIARIGQLNLIQPMMALGWSALLLGEQVSWPFFVAASVVLVSMAVCMRSRVRVVEKSPVSMQRDGRLFARPLDPV